MVCPWGRGGSWPITNTTGRGPGPGVLAALERGSHVAYASEAGTPLISDPGFDLGRAAIEAGFAVETAPGASAVLSALTVAGLPTDRFLFAGFLPSSGSARRRMLELLKAVPATLVFYESPHRIAASLRDAADVLGPRPAALCRELTKKFEETRRGTLAELRDGVEAHPPKGEIVLIIDRAPPEEISDIDLETMLREALETMSLKDAAAEIARRTGENKRKIYSLGLSLKG